MTSKNPFRLAGSALIVLAIACPACAGGDDGNSNATGGSSSGNSAAGSAAGGSSGAAGSTTMSGGSSAAGSAGSSGGAGSPSGGSAPAAQHCTPGTPQKAAYFIGGIVDQCFAVSGLTDFSHLIDIELFESIGPGDTFAFSVDMGAPEGDFDVYGATEECGAVGEKLSTVHVLGNGVVCHAVKPVTGTYSHLIWVWHTAGEMKIMAMCEAGTCPAQ